jgi:hypothetical protein
MPRWRAGNAHHAVTTLPTGQRWRNCLAAGRRKITLCVPCQAAKLPFSSRVMTNPLMRLRVRSIHPLSGSLGLRCEQQLHDNLLLATSLNYDSRIAPR